jgi:hypothetical protein
MPARPRPETALETGGEDVYLPADLEQVTHLATGQIADLRGGKGGEAPGTAAAVDMAGFGVAGRDPFHLASNQASVSRRQGGPQRVKLSCAAVLLGGSRPAAIINGQRYHRGDWIENYRVGRITTEGVQLSGSSGQRFLAVGVPDDEVDSYPVVTGTKTPRDVGRTEIEKAGR